jgi:uncharacterized protein YutD
MMDEDNEDDDIIEAFLTKHKWNKVDQLNDLWTHKDCTYFVVKKLAVRIQMKRNEENESKRTSLLTRIIQKIKRAWG